jgi:ketosteroid isomerase-like protein
MPTREYEVRDAANRFYEALNRMLGANDAGPMLALWSHGYDVTAMHPDGARDIGWSQVKLLHENWARHVSGGRVALVAPRVQLLGEAAIVSGWERGAARIHDEQVLIDCRVTLIFRREDGTWKVVHHHVDEIPAVHDLTKRLATQMGAQDEGYHTATWSIRYGFV